MNQSDSEKQKAEKNIGWIEIFSKRYGGVIHRSYVREELAKEFELEFFNLEPKHLKRFRYLKFLESFYYILSLEGEKDLWVRGFFETVFMRTKKTKGRNLVWIHHLDFSGYPVFSRPFLNFLNKFFFFKNLKKADFIVTISEYWRKYFEDLGHKNVYKIYGGFELEKYDISDGEAEEFKKEHNLEGKPIIYLGNCQKGKGVVESYLALKDLDAFLVTSGEKRADIPALNFNLEYRDYLKLLKASSIVLTMSKFKEGWCRTAHEAMLLKTPVVGSGSGGMGELLERGGQIVCKDFGKLKEKAEYLLLNPAAGKEIGEKGYQFAKDFSIEKTQKNWVELINRILK
ncbi:MAG: glycosyltransferase [Candidatus Staskawiczbacteria bacterium]|nr:glycosyltransferase [Candidatus Staskawiczbacteria bacterium]